MRKELILIVLMALVVLGIQSVNGPTVAADRGGNPPFVANEVLVNFQPGVSTADIATFYAKHGLVEKERLGFAPGDGTRLRLAQVKPGNMTDSDRFIRTLERDLRVEYAELNYILSLALHPPNDTKYSQLWGLNKIDAPQAWHDFATGSSSVIVGVIDTGVEYTHDDLAANMWINPGEIPGNNKDDDGNGYVDDVHGINAINNSGDPMDDHGHGTHTAGTIGAKGNNNKGVVGVNWDVRIVGCKFLSSSGGGSTAGAIKCFKYFNDLKNNQGQNVVVTNNSWGGGGFSQALEDAMAGLDQPGMAPILHAAAAGNSNDNNDSDPHYPSSYALPNIIAVAATDSNDKYAGFSSYGATSVDLAAPGVSILSTVLPTGSCNSGFPDYQICDPSGYASISGTSMATPLVAGAAALLAAEYPGLTAGVVKSLILDGVEPLSGGSKVTLTNGRLNVLNSMNAFGNLAPPPTVSLVEPASSTTDGGTWVNVAGTGFVSDAAVSFGGTAATSVNVVSDTKITAFTPAHAAGVVDVAVTNTDGQSGALTGGLTYLAPPPSALPPGSEVVAAEDFESNVAGWDAGGLWHLADDTSCVAPGYQSASRSFYYGLESTCDYNTVLTANSGALTSPDILLGGNTTPALTFDYWREVEFYAKGAFDWTYVEVSYDGGISWYEVWYRDSKNSSAATWTQEMILLYPGIATSMRVRFSFDTVDHAANTPFSGWLIDDVTVLGVPEGSGSIMGKVTQVVGTTPIEGAAVTVAGTSMSATTDENGDYSIDNVANGFYDVTATASGFLPMTVTNVEVASIAVVNFPLDATAAPTAPDAPTNASATAGDAEATVTWLAPASDGGSLITSYTVTSAPDGLTATTPNGSTLTAAVTGLNNGTSYTFTVVAANAVGDGPASAQSNAVTPTDSPTVPDASTNAAATAGDAEATVTWLAPASDGGSLITSYTVTSDPGGLTATTPNGSTLTAPVTGLNNGTPYTFTVVAANAVGDGPASTQSNAVTPMAATTVPGAPTNASATAGDAEATVTWQAPASDGGSIIINYTVTSAPGGLTATTPNGSTLTATVTGLTNGTPYTFTVMATNGVGDGPASAQSNAVTPADTLPPAAPTIMHVGDLGGGSAKLQKGNWKAFVTIMVHDDSGALVPNATVYGTFRQSGSPVATLSCLTGSNGNCTLDSGQLPSKKGKGTDFMVDNVTHGTLGYDGSSNHDPDGDSNGTTIQLSK